MDMRRWACMEEMREASYAYYENLTDHQKQLVWNFYNALDTDGNGIVSLRECWDFLSEEGFASHLPPDLFQHLDNNRNGILDFCECVTLLYIIKSMRLVKYCDACRAYLWGIHFLCVQCYEIGSRTYDLCCSCYRNKSFRHKHGFFLDNYALLWKKWMVANPQPPPPPPPPTQGNTANTWGVAQNNRPTSKREKLKDALLLLDAALSVTSTAVVGASLVSTGCSIM